MDNNIFDHDEDLFSNNSIIPSVETRLSQARNYIASGNHSQASPIVIDILREDKKNVQALWMYANLKKTDSPDKAIAALRTLLTVQPTNTKAKALLLQLDPEDDDLFDTFEIDKIPRRKNNLDERINITVTPNITVHGGSSQSVAMGGVPMQVMPIEQKNQMALWIGFLISLFTGIFGLAHLFNGKILAAFGYFILGLVWAVVGLAIIGATAGIGVFFVIPMHIYFAWNHSSKGATKLVVPQYMVMR